VALDLAGQGECVVLTRELQRDQGVRAGFTVERVIELPSGDGHGQRIGLQSVDDGRKETFTADAAGVAGAQVRAGLGLDDDVGHGA
jgi:hypothetical protein